MWTICKLAALAGLTAQAAAMALDSSFEALMSAGTEHRQLRAGRGQGGRGALDLNICGTRNAVRNGQTASPDTGTLHDDATDQAVDCTDGQSCGAAGKLPTHPAPAETNIFGLAHWNPWLLMSQVPTTATATISTATRPSPPRCALAQNDQQHLSR